MSLTAHFFWVEAADARTRDMHVRWWAEESSAENELPVGQGGTADESEAGETQTLPGLGSSGGA